MPILTTLGAACAKAWGFTSGLITDQYFNLVSLLLPGNGTNGAQNNTFLDSSSNTFTITRNGNTTQGTFSPFSQTGWGNYFGGSADWLTTSSSVTALGAGNWTVEFWLYPTTSGTTRIISDARTSSQGLYPLFGLSTANAAIFYVNTTIVLSSTNTVSANTWTHVAFVKNSATTTCYINGVASGSFSDSNTYLANPITFGASGLTGDSHGSKFTGYISNYRQVVGRAVYTSDFTPPTSPLGQTSGGQNPPTGVQTSLLTCQSNRFVDNSSSPYTITPSGSPSVVAFSPFAPTAAYTTAAVGGSGYFDGTGDYLSVANTGLFGSGDWTVEMWINAPVGQTDKPILECRNPATGSGSTTGFTLTLITSTEIRLFSGSELLRGTVNYINTWAHVAVSKKSGTTRLYLNGTSVASTASLGTMSDTTFLVAAGYYGSTSVNTYGQFYMSGLRVLTGTGYDTSTITIPTSPPTAITNTSLLLNFTNAGITDATAKNDLETVGNAQISTTQSKWGGGSMYFDGSSSYLRAQANSGVSATSMMFGTGPYTIEMWVYQTARNASYGAYIISNQSFQANITGSGTVNANKAGGADYATTTTTVPLNTWTHIAFVRTSTSANGFKIYINGTDSATGTDSTDYSSATQLNIATTASGGANYVFTGYIDDLRITRYARTITASPTAPFPVQ